MTAAATVATTSHVKTGASPASSNGKVSANKSSDCGSAGNYHLGISTKKRMGDVPHKSPGNTALVSLTPVTKKETFQMPLHLLCPLNLALDNIFCDDVSMDSFIKSFGEEQDKTQSVHPPVEIYTANRIDLGNRTATCTELHNDDVYSTKK